MKTWEVDVEVRLRKTLLLKAPTEEQARWVAELVASSFLKWSDGRVAYRPVPIEKVVDNDPLIVAVREVPDGP